MGAPKVSRAIFTMSIARTTPAQKPRGLSNNTRFWLGEVSAWVPFEMESAQSKSHSQYTNASTEQAAEKLNGSGKMRQGRTGESTQRVGRVPKSQQNQRGL